MGKCTVCSHSKRSDIDKALAQGESYRNIGARFTLSYSAVNRHSKKCVGKALARVSGEREQGSGLNILSELESVNRECKAVLATAKTKKDDRLVLLALDRICKQLDLQAKFLEVLQRQGPQGENKVNTIIYEAPGAPSDCYGCEVYKAKIEPWERMAKERTQAGVQ